MKRLITICFLLLTFSVLQYAQAVYITKSGTKYHSGGCSYLKSSSIQIDLKSALDKGLTPCSRCNPPTSVSGQSKTDKSPEQTIKKESSNTKTTTTRTRCLATTKKGTQCKRWAESGSNYCWQHK